MNRTHRAGVALIAASILALIGGGIAHATPAPAKTYVAVIWSMPSWSNSTAPTWPQVIVSHTAESTSTFVAFPETCGKQYQQDIYHQSDTTDSLIAGGHLNGPNNPAEDLISGGWGVAYELHQNAACETQTPTPTPTVSTTTPTPTPTPTVSTSTPTPTPTPSTSTPPEIVTPTVTGKAGCGSATITVVNPNGTPISVQVEDLPTDVPLDVPPLVTLTTPGDTTKTFTVPLATVAANNGPDTLTVIYAGSIPNLLVLTVPRLCLGTPTSSVNTSTTAVVPAVVVTPVAQLASTGAGNGALQALVILAVFSLSSGVVMLVLSSRRGGTKPKHV